MLKPVLKRRRLRRGDFSRQQLIPKLPKPPSIDPSSPARYSRAMVQIFQYLLLAAALLAAYVALSFVAGLIFDGTAAFATFGDDFCVCRFRAKTASRRIEVEVGVRPRLGCVHAVYGQPCEPAARLMEPGSAATPLKRPALPRI
jgi:hypothetical protein